MSAIAAKSYYVATLDRFGLALLTGGTLAGVVVMLLTVAGGERSPVRLALGWGMGTIVAMCAIVTVAGPAWALLHRRNHRGPGAAAATAGVLALALSIAAQMNGAGGGYRWASAIAVGLCLALPATMIGAAMQRVAYRRLL